MGLEGWDTPPTEAEISQSTQSEQVAQAPTDWDTPPTEAEIGNTNQEEVVEEPKDDSMSPLEWMTTPLDAQEDAYEKQRAKTQAKIEADKAKIKVEETVLDNQATQHKKKSYKEVPASELQETSWYDISGNKYTPESVAGYTNGRRAEMKANGTYTSEAKFRNSMYTELEDQGASPLDIQVYSQSSRGIKTGKEIFGAAANEALKQIPKVIEERGWDPFTNQARQNALAVSSIFVDVASIVPKLTGNETDAKKFEYQQAVLQEALATEKGIQDAYEAEYGRSAIQDMQSATELIPLIAMTTGKVVTLSAIAFADGFYEMVDSKRKGYSTIQAGAHGVAAATVTKALGGLMDIGENLYKGYKSRGAQFKEFTNITDLPTKYQKQVKELQKMNGWTDDEVMSMVRGFSQGLEEGKLNAIDSIRLLAQNSHHPEARELFEESVLYNRSAAKNFLTESSERSNDFLSTVSKKSDLGKIMHKNTITKYGQTSTNWSKAYNEAIAKGINPESTMMKRLKKNMDMFDDFDTAYHKSLIKKGLSDPATLGEDLARTASTITEAYIGRHIAKMTGTSFFMNMSIPKFVTGLLKKGIKTSKGGITETIEESLVNGSKKLNPMKLKTEIKKGNPNIPDDKIDDIVEEIVKVSQKSQRTIVKEQKANVAKAERAERATAKEAKIVEDAKQKELSLSEKERRKTQATTAKYVNAIEDLKLTGNAKADGKKIAKLVNKEARALRVSTAREGKSMTMEEAREAVAKKIDDILEGCN